MRQGWASAIIVAGLLVRLHGQDAPTRQDIEAVLLKRAGAMQANQTAEILKFFEAYTTSDYSHNGKPRDVLLSELRQYPARTFVIKATYQIEDLTVNGNTAQASVSCREYNPVMEQGITDPYKARSYRETSWTERIVWVKVPQQGWKMKTLDETSALNRDRVVPAPLTDAKPINLKTNSKDDLKYVWIAPGKFVMGCSGDYPDCPGDAKPAHEVTITKGFWLGQTEVTQAAYEKVIGKNPSFFRGRSLPVESTTWQDTQNYCTSAGGRLPTEAEWEYAARAGTTEPRYGDLNKIAWYRGNSALKTHEVGTLQPNPWGLYDMLGNVWEWTADRYDGDYYKSSPGINPLGPLSGNLPRVLRGGSWDNEVAYFGPSYRSKGGPAYRDGVFGFRCVLE